IAHRLWPPAAQRLEPPSDSAKGPLQALPARLGMPKIPACSLGTLGRRRYPQNPKDGPMQSDRLSLCSASRRTRPSILRIQIPLAAGVLAFVLPAVVVAQQPDSQLPNPRLWT